MKCWGSNYQGQLGNNNAAITTSFTPLQVVDSNNIPLSGVKAISAGAEHTCALTTAGTVKCWGWNYSGQLGNGVTTAYATPTPTPVSVVYTNSTPLTSVIEIAAGGDQTCALIATSTTNAVNCWGRNSVGQLGDGSFVSRSAASLVNVTISGISKVSDIVAGDAHTCARVTVGATEQMRCWGENDSGQLGLGGYVQDAPPRSVVDISETPLSGVSRISTGIEVLHSCAAVNGGAKCWGFNEKGQLGIGISGSPYSTAQAIPALSTGVTELTTGGDEFNGGFSGRGSYTCAIVSGGAKCWGFNIDGELGIGSSSSTPTLTPTQVVGMPAGAGVTNISAGIEHTCAVANGGAQCWGLNSSGQLGSNAVAVGDSSNFPVAVTGLTAGVQNIASGAAFTCALAVAGGLKCWGTNLYGDLGDNGFNDSAIPVDVVDSSNTPIGNASAIATRFPPRVHDRWRRCSLLGR